MTALCNLGLKETIQIRKPKVSISTYTIEEKKPPTKETKTLESPKVSGKHISCTTAHAYVCR
jgi:hypothetical protein